MYVLTDNLGHHELVDDVEIGRHTSPSQVRHRPQRSTSSSRSSPKSIEARSLQGRGIYVYVRQADGFTKSIPADSLDPEATLTKVATRRGTAVYQLE